jgi:hypothetical protein
MAPCSWLLPLPARGDGVRGAFHKLSGNGGHAEPAPGPAEGRTRWLCPPYDTWSSSEHALLCQVAIRVDGGRGIKIAQ